MHFIKHLVHKTHILKLFPSNFYVMFESYRQPPFGLLIFEEAIHIYQYSMGKTMLLRVSKQIQQMDFIYLFFTLFLQFDSCPFMLLADSSE